jgi:integrase
MAKYALTRDFIRTIQATGKYQEYLDSDLNGFALKVTPIGSIAYTYRWTKPDGAQGRKVIGHYPVMQPGEAREAARKEAALRNHQSSKQRHIPINRELLAVLTEWKSQAHKRYVFADILGQPLKRIQAWNSLRKAAELVDFRRHDFRHDCASRLVMAGVAINTVRDLLGHADIKMTLRYAHLSPDCRAAAVEMLCAHPAHAAQAEHYSIAA